MTLQQHLDANWLDYEIIDPDFLFKIEEVGVFLVVKPKPTEEGTKLFNGSFNLILSDHEESFIENIDYFAFCFGGKWYYYHKDSEPELRPLKYLGKAKIEL